MCPAIRLQKLLSAAGLTSRRAAETLIEQGRVSVNGETVTTLGARADPDTDDVRLDGRRVKLPRRLRYYVLNKPRGVVTTRSDPQQRRTVMDLLRKVRVSVYPVGRLDYDSEGLLLMTNDGELAARLSHPRHRIERVYEARVLGTPTAEALRRASRGIVVDGRRTRPARVRLLRTVASPRGDQSVVELTLSEGRNRQVRKMCEAIGHPVNRLRRVRMGPLTIAGLRPGELRELSAPEADALRRAAGL